ncbi:MAG: hypothetical protein M1814_003147 [Vezdaea aestivalis]|nr:MAG: hypothetical protein M1814_003147 [Vezdaea aestivalis]
MGPQDFDRAWTKQQKYLVDQMNDRTTGTVDEGKDAKTLLIENSRKADKAALFNFASMAHNNHFFFESLSPQPVQIPHLLSSLFQQDFSSIESLKIEFLATGRAMFGPGFIWIVKLAAGSKVAESRFRILATYLAGSPYPGAHQRRQGVDMNTQGIAYQSRSPKSEQEASEMIQQARPANSVGVMGPHSFLARQAETQSPDLATTLYPVVCINVWEHAWLPQHGFEGKEAYLEACWNHINWEEVQHRAELI